MNANIRLTASAPAGTIYSPSMPENDGRFDTVKKKYLRLAIIADQTAHRIVVEFLKDCGNGYVPFVQQQFLADQNGMLKTKIPKKATQVRISLIKKGTFYRLNLDEWGHPLCREKTIDLIRELVHDTFKDSTNTTQITLLSSTK